MDVLNLNVTEGTVAFNGRDGLTVLVGGGSSSLITSTGSAENPILLAEESLRPPAPVGSGTAGELLVPSESAVTADVILEIDWQ